MFFASTFSSKMQIDFLKVAWGISPLLHFLLRHSFGCRRGVVAGILHTKFISYRYVMLVSSVPLTSLLIRASFSFSC